MDRELWGRIADIFDAALDRPAGARASFVARACADRPALLAHVTQLLEEFERAGSFLEAPVTIPVRALSPGATVAARYRIDAALGRGGMGEVYRAYDEFVNETLALKVLRPDLAVNGEFVRRFRREVQLARRVTHANVCRVFDVGIHSEEGSGRLLHFYTMELLGGEPLSTRIRREGAIAEQQAYPIAAQLVEGLHAAHRTGVIHRDFKSANVMLCDRGAVITDFGLARVMVAPGDSATSTTSTNAQVAGTLAYMSPEQLAGEPITAASDIYSLGIVLFEMVTGRLPFQDRHIIHAAIERTSEGAPDIRALAPSMSPAWASVIERCLQRDPAHRFPDAPSVGERLRPAWRPSIVYWSRRRWTRAAIAGALSAAGVAAIPAYLRFSQKSDGFPEGARVLLGTIANATKQEQFESATELLRNQLAQSARLNLVNARDLTSTLRQMGKLEQTSSDSDIRVAGRRLNAALTIFGSVAPVGPDYALNIQLEAPGTHPETPRQKWLRSFPASDFNGLMRSVRDASIWIRETIGESAASIAMFDMLPENVTTPSWQALNHFAHGQRLYAQNDWDGATLKFEAALGQDKLFTLAAMRRADVLTSQSYQVAGLQQWREAIGLLAERPVTRAEELFGRGMFAFDSGDPVTADRFFTTWSLEYPSDWHPRFYRCLALCLNGHAEQALVILAQLRRIVPEYGDITRDLITCNLVLGRTDDARALIPAFRKLNPDRPARADLREAAIRWREGDCVGCLKTLRAVQQQSTYRRGAIDAMLQEALLLIDAGYPDAAATNVERFLERVGSQTQSVAQERTLRVAQAWAEMLAGRRDAAVRRAYKTLTTETSIPVGTGVRDRATPIEVALLGTILARLQARELSHEALRMTEPFQDIRVYQVARHRILGELARAEGRLDLALTELRAAAALEPKIAHRQYLIEALPTGSADRLTLAETAARVPWQNLRPPVIHHIGAMGTVVADLRAAGAMNEYTRTFHDTGRQLGSVL
jgi:serine/threonine protein kinase/tetratricopeptide (TPR) repeat protein